MTRSTNRDASSKLPSRPGTFEPRSLANGIPTKPLLTEIVRKAAVARTQGVTSRLRFNQFILKDHAVQLFRNIQRSPIRAVWPCRPRRLTQMMDGVFMSQWCACNSPCIKLILRSSVSRASGSSSQASTINVIAMRSREHNLMSDYTVARAVLGRCGHACFNLGALKRNDLICILKIAHLHRNLANLNSSPVRRLLSDSQRWNFS